MTPYIYLFAYITCLLVGFNFGLAWYLLLALIFLALSILFNLIKKVIVIIVVFALFIALITTYIYNDSISQYKNKTVEYKLKVLNVSATSGRSLRCTVKVLSINNHRIYQFNKAYFYTNKAIYRHGDIIKGGFVLSDINIGSFEGNLSYNNLLNRRNIYGTLKSIGQVEKVAYKPFWPKAIAVYLRDMVLDRLNESLKVPYNYILEGLLIGNHQKGIPDNVEKSFRKTGTIHVLVVSGAQVALITSILMIVCNFVGVSETKFFYIASTVNIIFMFISGADASIVRAVIMMQISLLSKLFRYNSGASYIMLLVAALMLSYNPCYIKDLSFLLSYMATFGLLVLQPLIDEKIIFIKQKKVREVISVALAPHLLTAPICMYFFSSYSLVSIPVNIIIAPIIDLIVYIGFAGILLMPLGFISKFLFFICKYPIKLMVFITGYFANVTGAVISLPLSNFLVMIIVYLLIFIFFKFKRKYLLSYFALFVLMFSFMIFGGVESQSINKSFDKPVIKTEFLDVGNGLSVLMTTPDNKVILYDAGSDSKDGGSKSIIQYLRKRGINAIDMLVISHGHKDHYGAVEEIVSNFSVKKIIIGGQWGDHYYRKLLKRVSRKVNVLIIDSLESMVIGDVMVTFYGDINSNNCYEQVSEHELNDVSIVMHISYFDYDLLLTGDIEEQGISHLIKHYNKDTEVLLVPHHGAQNRKLNLFFKKLSPNFAVISAGVKNKHGHPHVKTINVLYKKKVPYALTASKGTITVLSDGKRFVVKSRR